MGSHRLGLQERVQRFWKESAELNAAEAEERLLPLLKDLMEAQGFDMIPAVRPDTSATDYVGSAKAGGTQEGRIGVEYKHYKEERRVGVQAVEQVVLLAERANLDRVVLIGRPGFTQQAISLARQQFPVAVELLTPGGLLTLARSLDKPSDAPGPEIAALIRRFSHHAARLVAEHPDAL